MSSMFSPEQYLDVQMDQPLTKRPPIPVGDYPAIIMDVKAKPWQGKKDPTQSGIRWDVSLEVQLSPDVATLVGQPKILITDGVMLDMTEGGGIDLSPGKNRRLRLYREALDMNKPGDTFSARAMIGRSLKVKVKHDLYEGEIYEKADGVARA